MEAIKTALAELVAAEARVHELVDPSIIDERTRNLAKANAAGILALSTRVEMLEPMQVSSARTAINTPPLPLPVSVTPGPIANMDDERKPDILPDPKIAGDVPGTAGSTPEA